jgi:FkbM family methyltransferase
MSFIYRKSLMIRIFRLIKYSLEFMLRVGKINYYGAEIVVPSGLDWKTRLQIYSRRYERAEIDAVMQYWGESQTLLEIGGGAGLLASVLDSNCKPSLHVVYEPINFNYDRICAQKLLPSTTVHNYAVVGPDSDDRTLKFRIRERVFGSGFLADDAMSIESDKVIEVPTIGIKSVLENDFDIILMDVEGYEEVLLPAIVTLSQSLIIFEYHNDKCSLDLSDLFALCPSYTFTHFTDCTFVGIPRPRKEQL